MSANKGTHFYLGLFLTLDQLLVQLALVGLVSCCAGASGDVLAPSHLLQEHLPYLVLHGVGVLVASPPVPRCSGLPICWMAPSPTAALLPGVLCHLRPPTIHGVGGGWRVLVPSSAALLPGVTGPPTYYQPQSRLKCGGFSHV